MSIKKRMREALALADAIVAERNMELEIKEGFGKHFFLTFASKGAGTSRKVVFAKTPSCSRWLVHLKKDIRRVISEFNDSSKSI